MNKNTRCKNCKQTYIVHIQFILDDWDGGSPLDEKLDAFNPEQEDQCNRFVKMSNLEYLQWKHEQNKALDK